MGRSAFGAIGRPPLRGLGTAVSLKAALLLLRGAGTVEGGLAFVRCCARGRAHSGGIATFKETIEDLTQRTLRAQRRRKNRTGGGQQVPPGPGRWDRRGRLGFRSLLRTGMSALRSVFQDGSEKAATFFGGGLIEHRFSFADLQDSARGEKGNPVGGNPGKTHLVGDQNEVSALLSQLFDHVEDLG